MSENQPIDHEQQTSYDGDASSHWSIERETMDSAEGQSMYQANGTHEVPFTAGAYEALERLAAQQGKSITQVVEDALRLETFVSETRRKGGRILVQEPGSDQARELVSV